MDGTSLRIASEESVTSIKCIPAKKTPFAVIRSLQAKTIAQKEAPPKAASFREDSENSALERSVQSDSGIRCISSKWNRWISIFQVTRSNGKVSIYIQVELILCQVKKQMRIYTYSPGKHLKRI